MNISRRGFAQGLLVSGLLAAKPHPAFAFHCGFNPNGLISELGHTELRRAASPFATWMVNANTGGSILPTTPGSSARGHSLKNRSVRKFLQYEQQRRGINLGWTDDASATTERASRGWLFSRPTRGSEPIRFGELIAVGWNRSKPWLRYARRDHGINLVWSGTPSYEWKFVGGQNGGSIRTGSDWAVLYNTAHEEPMMYLRRPGDVAHIGWPDSVQLDDPDCQLEVARAAIRVLAA